MSKGLVLKEKSRVTEKNWQAIEVELKQAKAVISFMGEGLLLIDRHAKVLLANEAAGVLLREAPANLKNKSFSRVFRLLGDGQKFSFSKEMLEGVLSSQDIMRFGSEKKLYCEAKGGGAFPVALTMSPFATEDLSGIVVVFRDISREKELEESKDNFISITSHQLRTPLTSIRWYAEMLNDEVKKQTVEHQEFVDQIYRGTLRLNETINILLSLSRAEKGKITEVVENVNLPGLAASVADSLKLIVNQKGLSIKIHQPKSLPDFPFAIAKLRQVLANIMLNAVVYTPTKGKISVDFKNDNGTIICAVRDNGIGIPKRQQGRVFEKFFRAQNAFRTAPDGSGLGLALAKALVEGWGGKIWFESKEHKGTNFYFSIPLKV